MPDEFHSPLRRARAKEQMEPSQRDHEPHRPEASRLLGQDHTKLPHGQVVVVPFPPPPPPLPPGFL